jgi:hypothetical protein
VAASLATKPLIKPGDLVRTQAGGTVKCIELRPRGFRLVEDVLTRVQSIVHSEELYLVRAATPKPWPDRRP